MRALFFLASASFLFAQDPSTMLSDPVIKKAVAAAEHNEAHFIDEQVRICEIAAPPFMEQVRGQELARLFTNLGLENVRVDKAGNVIGVRPGSAPRPNVVFAAHLDTVFPEGTNVKVTREGTLLKGPGIGDDCRGLGVLLAVIQSLKDASIRTPGTLTFVADVGEEGLGDLRGMKELFGVTLKDQIDKFVSIDGTGLGVTNTGVGSYRYRVTFKGPGGHSFGSFGMPNPIQAMGRAIAKIDAFDVPSHPKTTFNVGRVGGGTSVNAIPFEAWMEVDMRSSDKASLEALHSRFKAAVADAVKEENEHWKGKGPVTAAPELVGYRPAGMTPLSSAIVQTVLAVSKQIGVGVKPDESSTDSNVPMKLGIPAITIGSGGTGAGAHSPQETFDTADSYLGTKRALLLAIALAR
jgi:acetylornithine deacetylase/succinyl-diaminopimelate desuccinylase-like protein